MRGTMRIPAHQVSPQLRSLFDAGQPMAIRCFAVLDGMIRGQVWTDDLARPTWGTVQEAAFDTLFLGGQLTASLIHELVEELRQEQDVALALWPDHPHNQLLPPSPDFDGWELEFTDRPHGADLSPYLSVPEGCELRPIDAAWFERCRYRDYYAAYFGERRANAGEGLRLLPGERAGASVGSVRRRRGAGYDRDRYDHRRVLSPARIWDRDLCPSCPGM